jgi:hypothetical protein
LNEKGTRSLQIVTGCYGSERISGLRNTIVITIEKETMSGAKFMSNPNTPPSIDRRDEIMLAVIALLIPLSTLPAMMGL